jgi:hypothetical protein
MGKKVTLEKAIATLRDKGWDTQVDDRYLTARNTQGGVYQLVPVKGNMFELSDLRAVPESGASTRR